MEFFFLPVSCTVLPGAAQLKNVKKRGFGGTVRMDSGWLRVARGDCGADAPLLAARPKPAGWGGSFLMVYRNKKQQETTNAGRLDAGFISVCWETRWLGHFGGFYVPEPYCTVWVNENIVTVNPIDQGLNKEDWIKIKIWPHKFNDDFQSPEFRRTRPRLSSWWRRKNEFVTDEFVTESGLIQFLLSSPLAATTEFVKHEEEWVRDEWVREWIRPRTISWVRRSRPLTPCRRLLIYICTSHVTHKSVVSRMNETCHIWMSHDTYE